MIHTGRIKSGRSLNGYVRDVPSHAFCQSDSKLDIDMLIPGSAEISCCCWITELYIVVAKNLIKVSFVCSRNREWSIHTSLESTSHTSQSSSIHSLLVAQIIKQHTTARNLAATNHRRTRGQRSAGASLLAASDSVVWQGVCRPTDKWLLRHILKEEIHKTHHYGSCQELHLHHLLSVNCRWQSFGKRQPLMWTRISIRPRVGSGMRESLRKTLSWLTPRAGKKMPL